MSHDQFAAFLGVIVTLAAILIPWLYRRGRRRQDLERNRPADGAPLTEREQQVFDSVRSWWGVTVDEPKPRRPA